MSIVVPHAKWYASLHSKAKSMRGWMILLSIRRFSAELKTSALSLLRSMRPSAHMTSAPS